MNARKTPSSLATLLVLSALAAAGASGAAGCSSSPNPAPTGADASMPDSATTNTAPDASTPDASTPDASTTDSATTPVDSGAPADASCSLGTVTTLCIHFDNSVVPDAARLP
jgi:hypothetical protein